MIISSEIVAGISNISRRILMIVFFLYVLVLVFFVDTRLAFSGVSHDLFGKVSVHSREDDVVYENSIKFIKVSYVPGMQKDRPYCSLSFVSLHNIGCDIDSGIHDGLLVSDGLSYDNYSDKYPALSCSVNDQGGGLYKLVAKLKSPVSEEKHEFTFLRLSGEFFKLQKYSGYNKYYSRSLGQYATEYYAPVTMRGEDFSYELYKQLPTKCSTLTVPALPE